MVKAAPERSEATNPKYKAAKSCVGATPKNFPK